MNYVSQVAEIERVQSNLTYLSELRNEAKVDTAPQPIDNECKNGLGKDHYELGFKGSALDITAWLDKNIMDPALDVSRAFGTEPKAY